MIRKVRRLKLHQCVKKASHVPHALESLHQGWYVNGRHPVPAKNSEP